jgi:hypothetical protein
MNIFATVVIALLSFIGLFSAWMTAWKAFERFYDWKREVDYMLKDRNRVSDAIRDLQRQTTAIPIGNRDQP